MFSTFSRRANVGIGVVENGISVIAHQFTDNLCEIANGMPFPCPYVENLVFVAGNKPEQPIYKIMDEDQLVNLVTVAPQCDRFAIQLAALNFGDQVIDELNWRPSV